MVNVIVAFFTLAITPSVCFALISWPPFVPQWNAPIYPSYVSNSGQTIKVLKASAVTYNPLNIHRTTCHSHTAQQSSPLTPCHLPCSYSYCLFCLRCTCVLCASACRLVTYFWFPSRLDASFCCPEYPVNWIEREFRKILNMIWNRNDIEYMINLIKCLGISLIKVEFSFL